MNVMQSLEHLMGIHQQQPEPQPHLQPGKVAPSQQLQVGRPQQQGPLQVGMPSSLRSLVGQHLQVAQPQQGSLGTPGSGAYQPQQGFGMQPQNLGGLPFQPYYQGGGQNQGPQNIGHFNPQLHDTGYFWNQ